MRTVRFSGRLFCTHVPLPCTSLPCTPPCMPPLHSNRMCTAHFSGHLSCMHALLPCTPPTMHIPAMHTPCHACHLAVTHCNGQGQISHGFRFQLKFYQISKFFFNYGTFQCQSSMSYISIGWGQFKSAEASLAQFRQIGIAWLVMSLLIWTSIREVV